MNNKSWILAAEKNRDLGHRHRHDKTVDHTWKHQTLKAAAGMYV